jgi:hypothetical protein
MRATCFTQLKALKGTSHSRRRLATMKFLDWCESVDHLVIPVTVDVGVAVFGAGLVTAALRYIFELMV